MEDNTYLLVALVTVAVGLVRVVEVMAKKLMNGRGKSSGDTEKNLSKALDQIEDLWKWRYRAAPDEAILHKAVESIAERMQAQTTLLLEIAHEIKDARRDIHDLSKD